jgi:hypothetical protein
MFDINEAARAVVDHSEMSQDSNTPVLAATNFVSQLL